MHTCTHMHMHTQARRQEVRQWGASINRTAGLLGKGEGGPHIDTKVGGVGGPLAIRHQTREIDQPPLLQAYIHTHGTHAHTHTCIFTHTHSHTRIHTHNAHINTHAHVCMCVHTCPHTFTHTQKYCWTANTLWEKCAFLQSELLKSPVHV